MAGESNTNLDGGAVDAVAELARDGVSVTSRLHEVDNRLFVLNTRDGMLRRVDLEPALPAVLEFRTLGGFCRYLEAAEEVDQAGVLVHVQGPQLVTCISQPRGTDDHLRAEFGRAVFQPTAFPFGSPLDLERMHIMLQTCFKPDEGDVQDLRKFLGSVRSTRSVGIADDGVSQTVEAKRGIAAVDTTAVKNPWSLAPWRTFPEVAQPLSPFILRFEEDEEPQAALYTTGDLGWQLAAVRSLVDFLQATLGEGWQILG